MTRSRRKSVPLLAREAAETAIVRKFNGNIGDEGSAHRDLFNAWCASAEEDFLRRLYVHLTDGELDAFSSTNGAPFNPHMPGPGPTDAEWCLSPSEQEKALGLLSQRPPEQRLKLSADVRPSGVPAWLRELPPDAPIYWRVTCAGWRSESHRTAAQCIADIEERITRQSEGFFLLCEVAQILVDSGRGRSAEEWKDDLISAYADGALPIYKASNRAPIAKGKRPYPPHDLVHVTELDAWLLSTTRKGFPSSSAISSPGQRHPPTTGDMFMPLEHAAVMMAHDQWPDTQANREWAIEVWLQKYPEQPAPLLNGRPDQSGFLAHARHDTEREIQAAIDALRGRRVLTLFSPNTIAPTLEPRGAMVSKDEIVRLMSAGEHLKDSASLPATEPAIAAEPLSPAASIARPVEAAEVLATTQQTSTVDRGRHMKREALISDNLRRWPTIERDLKDAAQNGLKGAAKDTSKVGWWWEGSALTWARARGKVEEASPGLPNVMTRTIHRMG